MPITRIEPVALPFAGRRYTPNNAALSAMYIRMGENLAQTALKKGEITRDGLTQMAQMFTNYSEGVQQRKAGAAALQQRNLEREDAQAFTASQNEQERTERAAERKAAADQRKDDQDRSAARFALTETPAGPVNAVTADLLRKFPETAGYVSSQQTLPARVTPGAVGEVAPPEAFSVKAPTDEQMARSQAAGASKAAQDAVAARAAIDDERQAKELKLNEQFRNRTLAIQEKTANRLSGGAYEGDFSKTGKDFLQTIPIQHRKTVEKIAAYDEDPAKVASMRGADRERMIAWVNQVNPNYDQSAFALRAPTRKAFTIGTQGQQINAINTALGHIDQMDSLITKLGNADFTPGNELYNWARTTFGSDKVTNFDTLKDALSAEVASVLSKGQATVSEIAEQRKKINAASSPDQLVGYMKTQIPIMGSKLANLDYQYKQAMGQDDPFSPLSANSKRILVKHGFDPSHPEIGGSPAPKTGGFIEAIDPQGNLHHAPAGTPLPAGWKLKQ